MVKLLDFIDGLVTEVRFRTKSVKHKQKSCKRATDKVSFKQPITSQHFTTEINEGLFLKCLYY